MLLPVLILPLLTVGLGHFKERRPFLLLLTGRNERMIESVFDGLVCVRVIFLYPSFNRSCQSVSSANLQ